MQFSRKCDGLPAILVKLYKQHDNGLQQPSTKSLQETLHLILDGLHSAYIIIDSLDECIERDKLLRWIEKIALQEMDNLHMVVASRPEKDISEALESLPSVDVAVEAAKDDIASYIEQQLVSMKKWDEETQATIKSKLTLGAQGMYVFFYHF
jgi:hypothetical protein